METKENFSFDVRDRELFFKINKSKYKIPSKMYPINYLKESRLISWHDAKKIDNAELVNAFDACSFGIGFCYSNAERIYREALKRNIKVEYFAGWLFVGRAAPIHHAWIVYKDSILDGSILANEFEYFSIFPIDEDNNKHREVYAEYIVREQTSLTPNSKKFIFGEVPAPLIYLGSPDTPDNARATFRKLQDDFPNHPSYKNKGQNMHGASKMQEKIFQKLKNK